MKDRRVVYIVEPDNIGLTVRLFFRALNGIFIPLEPEKPTKFEALSPL
jgi:hypothetical protein